MNRMKIFGILAVLLALLAFTGCDEILEAFYPEFAEGGDKSGTYQIGVWAEIIIPAGEPVPVGDPMIGAKVVDAWSGDPEPVAEAYISANLGFNDAGDTIFSTYIELFLADEGEYRVVVWGESDGNRQPDWDEAVTDAVWWHADANIEPDGGFWDNIFAFWADDPELSPWREGEAIIWLGGDGAAPNYQFKVGGPFVINQNEVDLTRTFYIDTADQNKEIADFSWDFYDDAYGRLAGQWVPLTTPASSAQFTVYDADIPRTAGAYTRGWYWIEINMTYTDGTYRYKRYPMRVIAEATAGTAYSVTVNIWDTDWEPMYLAPGSAYDVRIMVYSAQAGPESGTPVTISTVVDNATDYGRLQASTSVAGLGLNYNATDFGDALSDGIDVIEITVDSTNDGSFGPGDYRRRFPIGLDTLADTGDVLIINTGGWDFQPIL
jgi:hypothetical protein